MKLAISVQLPLASLFLTGVAFSAPACFAGDNSIDGKLKTIVQNTLLHAWQEGMKSGGKMGSNPTEMGRVPAAVDAASVLSVSCYREYTYSFDKADVASFEALIVDYQDLLATPNWERNVDESIDARYGDGSYLLKEKCDRRNPESRECQAKRSYDAIWARLYVKLYSFILESSQKIPEMLKGTSQTVTNRLLKY